MMDASSDNRDEGFMTLSDFCFVRRENGRLIIEIPEGEILREVGTRDLPGRVIDPELVLNYVAHHIRQTRPVLEEFETNLDNLVHATLEAAMRDKVGIIAP